ncbi:choice-of-anchor V domain-containing protein [Haliangium sp.]|uniref:choice-of-anchor V domain-containing protein n=1 Tax=Haliangium sp. TaxID=2663208 RepID=UPI003D0CC828
MRFALLFVIRCAGLAALLATQMGNAGGRAAVGGHGATGAPGETGALCVSCHNGGGYGPILELLEVTDGDGQIVATYTPGATYHLKFTVMEGAGDPAGYGFQLTSLDSKNKNVGTFQNLGANVKQSTAANTGNRIYLEQKGGISAARVFTAKWVAPAAKSGDVVFYYAGVVVNGNNAKTGDNGSLGSSITLSENGPGGLPRPYFEDFEFGPGGWMSYPGAGSQSPSSWALGAPQGAVITDAASGVNAWVTNLSGTHGDGEVSYLESAPMDMSWATSDPVVDFAIQYDTEANVDGAWLELSIDGGLNWDKLGALGSGTGWYNGSGLYGDWWTGVAGWHYASHPLVGAAGMPDVRVRFVLVADGVVSYEGIAIDDVAVFDDPYAEEPPPEEPPPEEPPPEEPPPGEPIEEPLPEPTPVP